MKYYITLMAIMATHIISGQLSSASSIKYHSEVDAVKWSGLEHDISGQYFLTLRSQSTFFSPCDDGDYRGQIIYTDTLLHEGLAHPLEVNSNTTTDTTLHYSVEGAIYIPEGEPNEDTFCEQDKIEVKKFPVGQFFTHPYHIVESYQDQEYYKIRLRHIWSYTGGQWAVTNSLKFGAIDYGETMSHTNNTDSTFYNGEIYGYRNTFNELGPNVPGVPSQPANDVIYRFDIRDEQKEAHIYTSDVGYNHYIHVIYNDDGTWKHLASDNGMTPIINLSLCPGKYYAVVEGKGTNSGQFQLNIAVDSLASGSIIHPRPWVQKGCTITSPIITDDAFSLIQGDYNFIWEKRNISSGTREVINGANNEVLTGSEIGTINNDIEVRRGMHFNPVENCGDTIWSNIVTIEVVTPGGLGFNGKIRGKVTGKNGIGEVANVLVCVISDPIVNGACPGEMYCDSTLANGDFSITGIYYGLDQSDWKVFPSYLDHEFDPDTFSLDLDLNNNVRDGINFEDTTTIFINGRITQSDPNSINETICGIPDVGLFLNGANQLPKKTSADGSYQLAIGIRDQNNRYVIRPDTSNYQFTPNQSSTLEILEDASGVDFINTRFDTIKGYVQACGNYCFGKVDVKAQDLHGGCFEYIQRTNQCGFFQFIIPARKYEISVFDVDVPSLESGYTSGAILQYFGGQIDTVDITTTSAELDLVYRQAPVIAVEGLPTFCSGSDLDTVLTQGEEVTIQIRVTEVNTDGCPLDTGLLIINDQVSDREVMEFPISNGVVNYKINPGNPKIFGDYKKQLDITVQDLYDPNRISNITLDVIVEGNRAREATFTTVSPEVPLLILRDPPGDQSYAFVEQSETTEMAVTMSARIGGGVSVWREVKAGAQFEAGFLGFSTESQAWASVNNELSIAGYNSNSLEHIWSVTNNVKYETTTSDELIGKGADLFVAGALNLRYALTDIIAYNTETCAIEESTDLIMGADAINTLAVYTRNAIQTTIIPDLTTLRDLQANPDSVAYYNIQINAWQQMLDRNEDLKEEALPDPNVPNISWDGGDGPISRSTSKSAAGKFNMDFQLEIERSIAAEAGFEVSGSGVSGGVTAYFRMEMGLGTSNTTLQSRTHGFVLDDDDPEDIYETEIFYDPVYSTPVFKNTSSKSSCPYTGGSLIDNPILSVDNPTAVNVADTGEAFFDFEITNGTELNETSPNSMRTYLLDIVDGSNPHGAVIVPGGDGIFPIRFENMQRGESRFMNIKVSRGDPSIYSYEGLKFVLYPECNGEASNIYTTLHISVFFQSLCSDITLASPEEGWIANQWNDNNVSINMIDYNKSMINEVILQYTPAGLNSWKSGASIDVLDMNNSPVLGSFIDWNISDIDDGEYDLRLRLKCNSGSIYTHRINGIIDRKAPLKLGIPHPIDDVYDPQDNDQIAIFLNENINCNNANVVLRDLESDELIPTNFSCVNNEVQIVPIPLLENRAPSAYRVTLAGIEDIQKNVSEEFKWVFVVGDYSYDPDCSPIVISNNNENQDAISQSVYQSMHITSNGTVISGSTIGYKAQEGINIESGFSVDQGGILEANIENCNE